MRATLEWQCLSQGADQALAPPYRLGCAKPPLPDWEREGLHTPTETGHSALE